LGIVPVRAFEDTSSTFKTDIVQICDGIVPSIELALKSMLVKAVKVVIERGNPSNALLDKVSPCKIREGNDWTVVRTESVN
jgi:hypothetical protein